MSRNEILEMARRATAEDRVQVVGYTESELAEQLALVELRRLAAKWHRQNATATDLERNLLNLIGNCSEPLSGRRIHELLAQNASGLLPGEVASCIWKLARDSKLSVRTDLKVVRLPTH